MDEKAMNGGALSINRALSVIPPIRPSRGLSQRTIKNCRRSRRQVQNLRWDTLKRRAGSLQVSWSGLLPPSDQNFSKVSAPVKILLRMARSLQDGFVPSRKVLVRPGSKRVAGTAAAQSFYPCRSAQPKYRP